MPSTTTTASNNSKAGTTMTVHVPISYQIDPLNMGVRKVYEFVNGYGASVVMHMSSYGGTEGLWELMVLKGGDIDYNNEVIPYGDPVGHLTDADVETFLTLIAAL